MGRDAQTEARIKEETKATIRYIPLENDPHHDPTEGTDMISGKLSKQRVVFA